MIGDEEEKDKSDLKGGTFYSFDSREETMAFILSFRWWL